MRSGFLHDIKGDVHFLTAGDGATLVICLHGYAETASQYAFLMNHPEAGYSFLSLDLPFHGLTQWKEKIFSPADFLRIINLIIKQENLHVKKLYLVGYSMGGRLALQLLEENHLQFQKLVLLAPDGLKVNFWYWLATQTKIGNRLFSYSMNHPSWIFFFLKIGEAFKLINPGIKRFIFYHLRDAAPRQELYNRWMAFRKFQPDLKMIRAQLRTNPLPVKILLGKYDRVIAAAPAIRFSKGLGSVAVRMLECGHDVVHEKNEALILDAIGG